MDFLTDHDVLAWAEAIEPRLADTDIVALARQARDALGPERGPAALTLARLRIRHRDKFPSWNRFTADREAFEQASGERAADWRAWRFAGMGRVLDLCCGAGADTIALSRVANEVVAADWNPTRLQWARHNVAAYGRADRVRFLAADCTGVLPAADGAVIDPDRRAEGSREFAGRAISPNRYSPPVAVWEQIAERVGVLAVKAAPGIAHTDIPDGAVAEFIEDRRELRETVLWYGERGAGVPTHRQAVVLHDDGADVLTAADTEEHRVAAIADVMYDPGPATVRARLITHLAARLGAHRIDNEIAYLSAHDEPVLTPFAAAFRVEAVVPWSLERVQNALAERNAGAVEIRARRFPVRPDESRRLLRLNGSEQRTLICTRVGGDPVVAICISAQYPTQGAS